jgi:hypothetical protein
MTLWENKQMQQLFTAAFTLAAITQVVLPAAANPIGSTFPSNRIGISASPQTFGLEGDWLVPQQPVILSVRGGWMGLPRFSNIPPYDNNGYWLSGWGTYQHALTPSSSVGAVVGISQSWFFDMVPIPFRNAYTGGRQPTVGILGISYQHCWDKLWIRLTPSIAIGDPTWPLDYFQAGMLGPGLVEIGYRVTPNSELSIRPSITPIAYSTYF